MADLRDIAFMRPRDMTAPPEDPGYVMADIPEQLPPVTLADIGYSGYTGPAIPEMQPAAQPAQPVDRLVDTAQPVETRPQLPPSVMVPQGGGGQWQGVLNREQRDREAELLGAAANVAPQRERYDQAAQGVVQAQQAILGAESRGQQLQADAVGSMRADVERQRMLDEGERLLEQDAVDARQQSINQGYDQLSRESVQDRRTTGQRAMGMAAVALASIGDGLLQIGGQRGNNAERVGALLQGQIDRDAAEQIRQISEKKEGLTAKERSLQRFLAQVGDKRAQRQYLIAQKWDELGLVSQQIAASANSDIKRRAAVELQAVAQQQSEAAKLAGAEAVAADAAERVRAVRDLGFQVSLKQALGDGQKTGGRPAAYGLRQVSEGTPGDATKAQEVASSTGGILSTLDQLYGMAQKGATLSLTQRQTAARRLASVSAQFNGAFGDGTAPNEAQIKQMQDVFLNPTEVNVHDVERFYKDFIQDGVTLTNAKMKPYGYVLEPDSSGEAYRGR